jgi:hypothetical protein
MRRGGVFSRHRRATSVMEAVRGRIHLDPSSMCSGTLYSDMNTTAGAGQKRARGRKEGVGVSRGGQKRSCQRSRLPQNPLTFVSDLQEKTFEKRFQTALRTDTDPGWMAFAVQTYADGLQVGVGDALIVI